MPTIKPVTKSEYAGKHWQRYSSYAFAGKDAIAPLVMQELPKAQLSAPIAFAIKDNQAFPVAVQSLQPGINMFVGNDGRWLGKYVPAAYRGYPFILVDAEENRQVLCIDEDSALVSDTAGEEFFGADGEPSQAIANVLKFLQQVHGDRKRTLHICSMLQKHELIQPWPIKIKADEGGEDKTVEGLYRVDEKAMNQLEYEAYQELSRAGAFPMAYCQLLSMQHLQGLASLHARRQAQPAKAPEVPDVDKIFGEKADDDMFSFNF